VLKLSEDIPFSWFEIGFLMLIILIDSDILLFINQKKGDRK